MVCCPQAIRHLFKGVQGAAQTPVAPSRYPQGHVEHRPDTTVELRFYNGHGATHGFNLTAEVRAE
jgi:hypothetical protein